LSLKKVLKEVIAPIGNTRYVEIRKNKFLSFINQEDYYFVREILDKKKNLAEHFKNNWEE